jgi:hypothetical protein
MAGLVHSTKIFRKMNRRGGNYYPSAAKTNQGVQLQEPAGKADATDAATQLAQNA